MKQITRVRSLTMTPIFVEGKEIIFEGGLARAREPDRLIGFDLHCEALGRRVRPAGWRRFLGRRRLLLHFDFVATGMVMWHGAQPPEHLATWLAEQHERLGATRAQG